MGGCGICRADASLAPEAPDRSRSSGGLKATQLWMKENGLGVNSETWSKWKELPQEEKDLWRAKALALSRPEAAPSEVDEAPDDDSEEVRRPSVGILKRFQQLMGKAKEAPQPEPKEEPEEEPKEEPKETDEKEKEDVSGEGEPSPSSPSPTSPHSDPFTKFLSTQSVLIVTESGMGKRVALSDLKLMSRNKKGVQAIKLSGGDQVCAMCITGSQMLPRMPRKPRSPAEIYQDAAAHAAGSPPEAAHAVGFESLSAAEQETYHQEHAAEELAYQEALKARKILEEELEEKIGQLLLCTSGGSILRLQVSEVEVMKRRQGGRCLMKVERSDSLISACLLSAVDAERDAPHSAECEREQDGEIGRAHV